MPVPLSVVFPHVRQIGRADDQCFQVVVVLKDACESRGHQGLAKPDDIADQHAAALVEVVRGNLDCCRLIIKEHILEILRYAKFG